MPSALRSSEQNARPEPHGLARRIHFRGHALDADLAAITRIDAKEQPRGLGAPGAEQAAQPDDFAGCSARSSGATAPRPAESARGEHRLNLGAGGRGGVRREIRRAHLAAEHLADQREPRQLRRGVFAHEPAVAQHGDPVGERVDLVEEMRDEHDAEPAGPQLAHDAEKFRDLLLVEARGGFVEHEQLRLRVQRARDGDHLLERNGKRTELGVHVAVHLEARQRGLRAAADGAPVEKTRAARLAAERDVLRDR